MVSREFPPHGGGIGSYTAKTARALAGAGHEVHVFTEARDGDARTEIENGVSIHRLSLTKVRPREARVLLRAWRVARALRRYGPFDVVQAAEWDGEAALFAMLHGRRLITRISTPHYVVSSLNQWGRREQFRQALLRLMERWQTSRSRHIVSPSRAMADIIARDWKIDRGRISVVATGISLPSSNGHGEIQPATGAAYVLYFGRLEVRKGVHTLIDALPAVLTRWPEMGALFVGEDLGFGGRSFADYARERCSAFWPRLTFLDHLPHSRLFPLIESARVVVLPSRWENLPNTCLEAMAVGRPVVATTGSAFEELIEDGVSGKLVPPDDPIALAEAINDLLADPDRLRSMGEAARLRAQAFDIRRALAPLLAVYRTVTEEASRA
jgi:glycosyltransferase involved in cell wall biosynthesis